ncbi:MAG TPA: CBS domain-containing protein [Thermodesulfobacteriota bacterium]|nr:CBS domain-containing protein [Thermodesulfobacteriota bacterium]
MLARNIMRTDVVTVSPSASVTEAAHIMRDGGIGALVVTDDERRPVGIVTDRDIVVSTIADHQNPDEMLLEELMNKKLVNRKLITVNEDADVFEILRVLSKNSIRRVPVTKSGRLVGIVSVDDMVVIVATELTNLASALSSPSKVL